ncbi:hypothetical protein, partial [Bradyrhizobium campsiandrae]|uniref:hypothetical protein n=1 Tax=Bradyrhizobium campsiandrae TaxID=1729892 RepID=UPI003F66867D
QDCRHNIIDKSSPGSGGNLKADFYVTTTQRAAFFAGCGDGATFTMHFLLRWARRKDMVAI